MGAIEACCYRLRDMAGDCCHLMGPITSPSHSNLCVPALWGDVSAGGTVAGEKNRHLQHALPDNISQKGVNSEFY